MGKEDAVKQKGFSVEQLVAVLKQAELASLIDPSLPPPFFPTSIFTGVQLSIYWSASSNAASPTFPWVVYFTPGFVCLSNRTSAFPAWCVLGGMQESLF